GVPADGDPEHYKSINKDPATATSAALSMVNTVKDSIRTRVVAVLAADGVNEQLINAMKAALKAEGATAEVIAPQQAYVLSATGKKVPVDKSFLTTASVFYDAVYVPGGADSVAALEAEPDAIHFLNEAYKHCKAIAADEDALPVLKATYFGKKLNTGKNGKSDVDAGVVIGSDAAALAGEFIAAIAQHRFWEREKARKVPA
ncbi:MAG: DJ-1/PfpI family protein, partial [Taibaiella sp.]|nr:DJ-1/PfpI family protein [Taibaiella sp.]